MFNVLLCGMRFPKIYTFFPGFFLFFLYVFFCVCTSYFGANCFSLCRILGSSSVFSTMGLRSRADVKNYNNNNDSSHYLHTCGKRWALGFRPSNLSSCAWWENTLKVEIRGTKMS